MRACKNPGPYLDIVPQNSSGLKKPGRRRVKLHRQYGSSRANDRPTRQLTISLFLSLLLAQPATWDCQFRSLIPKRDDHISPLDLVQVRYIDLLITSVRHLYVHMILRHRRQLSLTLPLKLTPAGRMSSSASLHETTNIIPKLLLYVTARLYPVRHTRVVCPSWLLELLKLYLKGPRMRSY
ncbi:hypothetical protein GGR52DRAFT_116343 [Hypoxylon sp. FL1284]|nr:hypothetical protein GGR52DRAFT_116343 [Hypoxylon sp. FL1284]